MRHPRESIELKSLLLSIFLFFYEALILFLFIKYYIPTALFLVLYLISLALIALLIKSVKNNNEDLTYPLLLFISTYGSICFGIFGFFIQSILMPIFSKFSTPANEWLNDLFPEIQKTPFKSIYQRIRSRWDDYAQVTEVNSFQDIFSFGTLSQKQAVLDMIVKDFNPIYAPILVRALDDPHNSVRIQAAAIVSKIDYDFDQEIAALLAGLKENHEVSTKSSNALLELGKKYDSYASCGILDSIRIKEMSSQAIYFYLKYLETTHDDRNVRFSIGRLLFHSNDFENFIMWREEFLEKYKVAPSIVDTWYKEALYKLKRFEDLSMYMRGMIGKMSQLLQTFVL